MLTTSYPHPAVPVIGTIQNDMVHSITTIVPQFSTLVQCVDSTRNCQKDLDPSYCKSFVPSFCSWSCGYAWHWNILPFWIPCLCIQFLGTAGWLQVACCSWIWQLFCPAGIVMVLSSWSHSTSWSGSQVMIFHSSFWIAFIWYAICASIIFQLAFLWFCWKSQAMGIIELVGIK